MNLTRFASFILLTAFVIALAGCSSKPTPDPLAGFHVISLVDFDNNKAITDDFNGYIQKLSPGERKNAGPFLFYEDGTNQHAVELQIGINGTEWMHVLIYNKDNKRIKTLKYSIGHYAS